MRFHAVYWPALLLSASQPLPTRIVVRPYLTANGRKLSKSTGNVVDPVEVAERFGTAALRWWLLSDVPRVADADYTDQRLIERHDADLANGIGNLATRLITMIHRVHDGRPPATGAVQDPTEVASHGDDFDLRAIAAFVNSAVAEANERLEESAPWLLARAERAGNVDAADQLDESLSAALASLRRLTQLLIPLTPGLATRLERALTPLADGRLPAAEPLVPRLGDQ